MNVDLSQLITAEARAASALTSARVSASVTRRAFCLGLARLEILSPEAALASAKGGWPAEMDGFLSFLDPDQALEAQIEWAAVATVDRMHPMVLSLASWLTLSDTQVDALFGI
jgi:hypothetical protein